MSEEKKISFGFSKLIKKSNLITAPKKDDEKPKIQLIDCLEAQTIKVIGEEEKKEKEPRIIPLPQNRNKNNLQTEEEAVKVTEAANLEELAAQELINESKNATTSVLQPRVFTITKLTENGQITGEPESTMEDYENVPINEFGLALLRGMGWKEDQGIGKNQKTAELKLPPVRPKGMGLGADKMCQQPTQTQANSKKVEELKVIKGAYVRVISGRHKNKFGQILGFDDDAGSVIIKMALDGTVESLQEFLITPISKEDYGKNSKVINLDKYEEYKMKKEKEELKSEIKKEQIKTELDSSIEIKEIKESPTYISSDSDTKSHQNNRETVREKYRERKRYDSDEKSSPDRSRKNKKNSRKEKNDSDIWKNKNDLSKERSRKSKKDKKRYDSDTDEKSYSKERKSRKNKKQYDSDSDEDSSKDRRSRKSKKEKKRYDSYSEEEYSKERHSRKSRKDKDRYDNKSEDIQRKSKKSHKRSRSKHR